MESEIIKLISELNSKEYYENRIEQNVFNYTTDGTYWLVMYGNIKIADNIDNCYEDISEVKLAMKKFMVNLAKELNKDSKLLD